MELETSSKQGNRPTQERQESDMPESEHQPQQNDAQSKAENSEKGKIILSTSVRFVNQDMLLTLFEFGFSLSPIQITKKQKGLDCVWCDLVAAEIPERAKNEKPSLSLHYIEQQKNKKLRLKKAVITCTGDDHDAVVDAIQEQCQTVPNRPKKLFVLINPIGGNRKGVQIYQKKIAPIFALAKCETTVVTTEKARHAIEIGETQDFSGYDGIVCVSGDGLYQELLEGYTRQLQRSAGIDSDNPHSNLARLEIPFCLIPAGSSNGTVRYTNDGVVDLETSALRILRGEIHRVNVVTVYEPGKLIGVCGLAFCIGLITDVLKHSDQRRWMGRMRYAYSFPVMLLKKRRKYDAQVEYLHEEDRGTESSQDAGAQKELKWQTYEASGKVHTNTSFLVARLMNVGGRTVFNVYSSSGCLLLDTGCTNWELIKFGKAIYNQSTQSNNIPNMKMIDRVVGLRVTMLEHTNESTTKAVDETTHVYKEKNMVEDEVAAVSTEANNKVDVSIETAAVCSSSDKDDKESKCSDKEDKHDKDSKCSDKEDKHDKDSKCSEKEDKHDKDSKCSDKENRHEQKDDKSSSQAEGGSHDCKDKEMKSGGGDGKTDSKTDGRARKDKQADSAARARAEEEELEQYVYLDGEVRRVDGRQFECRFHEGFVPMFGCLPSGFTTAGDV